MSRMLTLSFVAALTSTLVGASLGLAQETPRPKDDALDSLLEKLDEAKSPDPGRPAPEEGERKEAEGSDPTAPEAGKPTEGPAGEGKGEVDSKDQALDDLLEKLGETKDAPSPEDRPKAAGGPPGGEPMPPKPQPDKPKADEPTGEAKDLDRHLEELTGRRTQRSDRDRGGEGSGPLSDVIKKMREVEERLEKTETGQETRQKQAEIVKGLDRIIDQLRSSSGKPQGKSKMRLAIKPGQQPGSRSGPTTGASAGQAPNQKPLKPTERRALVNGKDEWGHLPEALRLELENVMKEAPLSTKEDLIRRYYLSVSKKSLSREE
jgi:hypothetical protein